MSRIDDLIQELCPDGVPEWRLGDVAAYSKTKVDASDLDAETFVGVDNLVADKKGRVDAAYPPNTSRLTAFRPGDILLGNIRPYLKKVWLSDRAGGCSGDVLALRLKVGDLKKLIPKFLYYVISSDKFFAFNMKHAKGAKMPRGSKPEILNYPVPIPPLEVQEEIVRILDTFSALTAELEAELEARRTQYEHYRDALLRGDLAPQAEWVTLGEVGRVAMCKRIFKNQTASEGEVPFFKIGTFGKEPDAFIKRSLFNEYREKFPYPRQGDVLLSASGTIGRAIVYDGQDSYFQDSNIVWLAHSEDRVLNGYLYHWYKIIQWATDTGGTIRRLYNKNILKAQILLPALAEQERIVRVLDRFELLTSDLSSGLPAEIEARRKQYEFYRDRLLSFEEAVA